jgi:hypothetical protein
MPHDLDHNGLKLRQYSARARGVMPGGTSGDRWRGVPPRREEAPMPQRPPSGETYNPWTIVNVVFQYLADQGLHPTLGEAGDPGVPAADLLRALGVTPTIEGDARISAEVSQELAELRAAMADDS